VPGKKCRGSDFLPIFHAAPFSVDYDLKERSDDVVKGRSVPEGIFNTFCENTLIPPASRHVCTRAFQSWPNAKRANA
jgi:hypothetical protein